MFWLVLAVFLRSSFLTAVMCPYQLILLGVTGVTELTDPPGWLRLPLPTGLWIITGWAVCLRIVTTCHHATARGLLTLPTCRLKNLEWRLYAPLLIWKCHTALIKLWLQHQSLISLGAAIVSDLYCLLLLTLLLWFFIAAWCNCHLYALHLYPFGRMVDYGTREELSRMVRWTS